jgi:MFS family permease
MLTDIIQIAYIIFEVPSNMLLKKMTPRLWQSRIIVSWGIVLACHAAIQNRDTYYGLRFLLGMMEAGFFPGLAAQLCSWYRSDEMSKPIMWMFGWQNCAGIFGSLIAYGISHMNGLAGLSAWRWVYLLEGIATVLLGVVVWFVLPDYPKSPRSAAWLSPREQEYLEARLSENAPRTDGICAAAIIASWACNLWTWWLTRDIEWDVLRVRRLRIQAEKSGEVLSNDDVKYFDERQFYGGLHKRDGEGVTGSTG